MANGTGERPTYTLAVVMAGAVSAGAYTAGVMDFLIQALDAFERAKQAGRDDCPTHDVRIKVLAGASAGGMVAGIAASALRGKFAPVTRPESGGGDNPLYRSWVRDIDIEPLLDTRDLADPAAPVASVLDSTPLQEIARRALEVDSPRRGLPGYIATPLHVMLSVANTRGIPYKLDLIGAGDHGYGMLAHADMMHFGVGAPGDDLAGLAEQGIAPLAFDDEAGWDRLAKAALATGAFPIALSPRVLERPFADYDAWRWRIPLSRDDPRNPGDACSMLAEIPPDWRDADGRPIPAEDLEGRRYEFLAVDGGVINNEPVEFARRILSGTPTQAGPAAQPAVDARNDRSAETATRAVLLIDPFPNVVPFQPSYTPEPAIPSLARTLFSTLKQQARFKPDELVLAQRQDVFSRWFIAPKRVVEGQAQSFPIASGAVGGFGGFLCEDFRAHDFFLGRRNCQRFLQKVLALPLQAGGNPVVAKGYAAKAARDAHAFAPDDAEPGADRHFVPIIPLLDDARKTADLPPWPSVAPERLAALQTRVKVRADALARRGISEYIDSFLLRQLLRVSWWRRRGGAVEWIMDEIADDLRRRGLFHPAGNAEQTNPPGGRRPPDAGH